MQFTRTPPRHALQRAALVVALIVAGAGTASAHAATGVESASPLAHVLPDDRAIALIEGLDPANPSFTFTLMPTAHILAIPRAHPERLNICIPCDNLA